MARQKQLNQGDRHARHTTAAAAVQEVGLLREALVQSRRESAVLRALLLERGTKSGELTAMERGGNINSIIKRISVHGGVLEHGGAGSGIGAGSGLADVSHLIGLEGGPPVDVRKLRVGEAAPPERGAMHGLEAYINKPTQFQQHSDAAAVVDEGEEDFDGDGARSNRPFKRGVQHQSSSLSSSSSASFSDYVLAGPEADLLINEGGGGENDNDDTISGAHSGKSADLYGYAYGRRVRAPLPSPESGNRGLGISATEMEHSPSTTAAASAGSSNGSGSARGRSARGSESPMRNMPSTPYATSRRPPLLHHVSINALENRSSGFYLSLAQQSAQHHGNNSSSSNQLPHHNHGGSVPVTGTPSFMSPTASSSSASSSSSPSSSFFGSTVAGGKPLTPASPATLLGSPRKHR